MRLSSFSLQREICSSPESCSQEDRHWTFSAEVFSQGKYQPGTTARNLFEISCKWGLHKYPACNVQDRRIYGEENYQGSL
uniref:Uncharacterized protein n=1 Tax=Phlebotomus papatasi TaxID=29031 RepID=A0A1B0CYF0_PHLPP